MKEQRVIKFRAWNKVWAMMLPVDSIDFVNKSCSVTVEASDYDHKGEWSDYVFGEDIILMSFTGLHDKNGKPIFEGDLITAEGIWQPGEVAEIIWTTKYNGFGIRSNSSTDPMLPNTLSNIEVLGNIYENPEPLEKIERTK